MSLHNRIKEARNRKGLTQTELGDLIGVAKTTIAGYERQYEPSAAQLGAIADALDVDVTFLLQDEIRKRHELNATPDEMEHLVKKYRLLDPYGKEAVDGILDVESRRCEAERQDQKGEDITDPNDSLNDEEKDFMSYVRQLNHGQQEMLLEHLQQLIVQQRFSPTASTQA